MGAASAAATITDTVLGINSSDTLLGDGSGVISGEITGVEGKSFYFYTTPTPSPKLLVLSFKTTLYVRINKGMYLLQGVFGPRMPIR